MADETRDESSDRTQDLREETREMMKGLEVGPTETLVTIVNYLPTIASKLEGVRQELTFISSILEEEYGTPDEEIADKSHEEIGELVSEETDIQLHKITSILEGLSKDTDHQSR